MNIRKMGGCDANEVSQLIGRNFDEVMAQYHSANVIEKFKSHNTPEELVKQLSWKEIYVIEIDGEIIATGAIANFGSGDSPKYSVSNFFVKPELHRKGVGQCLFQYLLDKVKKMEIDFFHVPSSRNGFCFYEKMGFSPDDFQPDEADEITWMTMKLR